MDHCNLMDEVRDINLSYLMLAQRMVREDQAMAVYRLGISQEIAQLIDRLSTAQLLKLASSPMMLTRFRFDDGAILGMITHDSKERQLAHAHSAILLAGQPVEEIL